MWLNWHQNDFECTWSECRKNRLTDDAFLSCSAVPTLSLSCSLPLYVCCKRKTTNSNENIILSGVLTHLLCVCTFVLVVSAYTSATINGVITKMKNDLEICSYASDFTTILPSKLWRTKEFLTRNSPAYLQQYNAVDSTYTINERTEKVKRNGKTQLHTWTIWIANRAHCYQIFAWCVYDLYFSLLDSYSYIQLGLRVKWLRLYRI